MKGYKAFEKGLKCRGKQYAENTVFEEEKAEICECGIHFCKEPLDVLNYYPLVNEKGEISEFAKVEALDESLTNDNKKFCTKKIKIGSKISFEDLVKASINLECEEGIDSSFEDAQISSSGGDAQICSSGGYAQIGSSGNYARIGSSGISARISSSGISAQISSSGNYAQISSSGISAQISSSGISAQISSSGGDAQISSSGNYAQISSSGNYARIGSSGISARISSSGISAQISSSGNYAQISSSGISAQISSSGNYAQISSSGDNVLIDSTGKNSIIFCVGDNCKAKGKIGSWITLAEWIYDKKEASEIPICVKTEKIDGERIKADIWYTLKKGEFVEIK